jgi:tRNA threonylcarbamoyl adenosine modification protein YjeE
MQTIWSKTMAVDGLDDVARAVVAALGTARPFCLWLQGSLGAGKTTLTGAILRQLGLPAAQPVTSPTFTYLNEYRIGTDWYAHLDLYRLGGASQGMSPEDLGLVDSRPFAGYFVEWPDQIPASPALAPTHTLAISFAADGATRRYELSGAP